MSKNARMKKYTLILAVVIPVFLLVLIRSITGGHFRNNASQWAEPSFNQSNMLTREELSTLVGENLIICLDDDSLATSVSSGEILSTPPASLIDQVNLKKLRLHRGNIILVAADPALSARMWMLLSQLGYQKIYILTNDRHSESFNYKFRPVSLN